MDSVNKQKMHGEFENWFNVYGKDIKVRKSNKTLHLILMRWTTKDDKPTKRVEAKCDGSEEEEDEGYRYGLGFTEQDMVEGGKGKAD